MEEIMLNLMFDLPGLDNEGVEYVIDGDAVRNKPKLEQLRVKRANSA